MSSHNPPAAATGALARLEPVRWVRTGEFAKVIWARKSPAWTFDDATLQRAAAAFDNPDYVDVMLHSYRHRLGFAPGHPPYEEIERS